MISDFNRYLKMIDDDFPTDSIIMQSCDDENISDEEYEIIRHEVLKRRMVKNLSASKQEKDKLDRRSFERDMKARSSTKVPRKEKS